MTIGLTNKDKMTIIEGITELDKILSSQGLTYTLYTCGGAQLIFLGYTERRTEDVDLIHVKLDESLVNASIEVAKKLNLSEDWLNNEASSLGKRLGKGWKSKTVLLFEGKSIKLMGLNRQHLINSKLHAAVDRKGEDYQDLLFLKPDSTEIDRAEEYTLKQKSDIETYSIFVKAWVKELKSDLGLS